VQLEKEKWLRNSWKRHQIGHWEKGNALIRKAEEEMVAVPGPDAWSESLF
jgi:hypothetical protein